jgi:phosphoglycolate phosphatase
MKPDQIRTVIFDLDGTLLDTLDDLAAALNHALSVYSAPPCSRVNVRRFVGNGINKLVERALPGGTAEPHYAEIVQETRQYYAQHCTDHTAPYAGIPELLRAIAPGRQLAVVSNKPDRQVKELCAVHFGDLITAAVGNRPDCRLKPAPDAIWNVMMQLQTDALHTVYIGDSDVDLETARNAGIPCISVLWGYRDRDLLEERGGSVFAETPQDLGLLLTETGI